MLQRHGVQVQLGVEATAERVMDAGFDEVVVATGAQALPVQPSRGQALITQEQALADPQALGQRVAFYDLTGEWTALSVIEHLADLGKQVTVFTPVAGFAWRATIYSTLSNRKRLRDKGVRLVLLRQLLAYDGRVLQLEDVSTGEVLEETGFDSVVGAQYGRSDQTMELGLKAAQGHRPRWHLAGDCLSPRTALEAVYEGHALARAL